MSEVQVVVFAGAGSRIAVEAKSDANLLLLSGEPIVGQGPFVTNSQAEIAKAATHCSEPSLRKATPNRAL